MFGIGDKVLAMIGGGLSAVLGLALVFTVISKNAEIKGLDKAINHPVTGYAVKLKNAHSDLATCKANRITIEDAARQQSEAVAAANAAGQQRIDTLARQLENAKAATRSADKRATAILAAKPGEDICASADALILESL